MASRSVPSLYRVKVSFCDFGGIYCNNTKEVAKECAN